MQTQLCSGSTAAELQLLHRENGILATASQRRVCTVVIARNAFCMSTHGAAQCQCSFFDAVHLLLLKAFACVIKDLGGGS